MHQSAIRPHAAWIVCLQGQRKATAIRVGVMRRVRTCGEVLNAQSKAWSHTNMHVPIQQLTHTYTCARTQRRPTHRRTENSEQIERTTGLLLNTQTGTASGSKNKGRKPERRDSSGQKGHEEAEHLKGWPQIFGQLHESIILMEVLWMDKVMR